GRAGRVAGRARRPMGAAATLLHGQFADELEIDGDGDLVADRDAAGFDGAVPGHAEVLAADAGGGSGADALAAAAVADGSAHALDIESHRAGDAADGEVARELEPAAGGG